MIIEYEETQLAKKGKDYFFVGYFLGYVLVKLNIDELVCVFRMIEHKVKVRINIEENSKKRNGSSHEEKN